MVVSVSDGSECESDDDGCECDRVMVVSVGE